VNISLDTLKEKVDNHLFWLWRGHSPWCVLQGAAVGPMTWKATCNAKVLCNPLSYVWAKSLSKTLQHAVTVECHSRNGQSYGIVLMQQPYLGLVACTCLVCHHVSFPWLSLPFNYPQNCLKSSPLLSTLVCMVVVVVVVVC
jgi:hypothetical protein